MTYDKVFEYLDNNGDKKVNTVDEIRGLMFCDLLCPPGAKKHYEQVDDIKLV